MKTKVDYEKAWKRLRRVLNSDDPQLCFHAHGITYFDSVKLSHRMDKIRKQCTEPQKKKPKESAFEKEAKLKREQVDFSDPNF